MSSAKPDKWYAVSIVVTPDYVEPAEFAFNGLDSLGSDVSMFPESGDALCTVTAYFSSPPAEQFVLSELQNAARIYELPDDIDFALRQSLVEDQDWLAEWKKYWKPVKIGRFIIAAPWHQIEYAGKLVIRIEPNMAFGTGTHETTQLCLAAIDENYRDGRSFLDVGTGTGILAIAASMMSNGSDRIGAVDTDADAVAIARTNASLNGVSHLIEFSAGPVEAVSGRFDVVCANLTADVIVSILPALLAKCNKLLILSGILGVQEDAVLDALPKGLNFEVTRAGEWIAVIAETGN